MTFQPNLQSLNAHRVPQWYDDAKFGIFVHWGLFSIPGFASRSGSISDAFRDRYDTAVAHTPYTEWYWNAIRVPESESAAHHREAWGDAPYENFREPFLKGLEQWRPDKWADLFAASGARYVVLVTKHHDGFCLWPSTVRNPHQENWTSPRDIVGELGAAVRARGLKFGLYYSGGIDWTFNREPMRTLGDFMAGVPGGDYPAYAEAQTRELIDRYRPSVLWNDISWPTALGPELQLFADYYNAIPDGVLNDRWLPMTPEREALRTPAVRAGLDAYLKERMKNAPSKGIIPELPPHCDFRTPEYARFDTISEKKWEATRGMSHSFGFNRRDTDADYESVESLVHGFIDAVSKNGNLLLNVGPRGEDAQIPAEQVARLQGFGAWAKANGDGIYGTRPWTRAEGRTQDGGNVRFTAKPGALFAHLLQTPATTQIVIEDLPAIRAATHLASGESVPCEPVPGGLRLTLPRPLNPAPAHAFRLDSA
ncbi:MAG TPA: alpha-L-fucosidase [Rhizomicrobium sp.]|jgi:alpha-L-fucosidase|nr:alpha-L-fucosidase [Rhizomicrobium sp.]